MLTPFPTYSLYQLSYNYNFLNSIALPFSFCSHSLSIAMALHILFGVLASICITLHLTSIKVFLNAGSFLANLPAVSGVSSTLACKIIYRVMASVGSDYTAHVIFKVQERFFEYPFTYYSLETPKCCSLQKKSSH